MFIPRWQGGWEECPQGKTWEQVLGAKVVGDGENL